jgi:hypothetical protein
MSLEVATFTLLLFPTEDVPIWHPLELQREKCSGPLNDSGKFRNVTASHGV